MLNSILAFFRGETFMRTLTIVFSLLLLAPVAAPPAQNSGLQIRAPVGGQALQGTVVISGTTVVDGFFSYEVGFGFVGDETGTWFLIAEGQEPVVDAPLAEWDTFAISDGNYNLRLLVNFVDGSTQSTIVEGIRVRNYSEIETSTPTPRPTRTATPDGTGTALVSFTEPPPATETPEPSATALPPTATALPPNPAGISGDQILNVLIRAGSGVLAALILLGLYTSLRRRRQ
jgi:hypothetical protein